MQTIEAPSVDDLTIEAVETTADRLTFRLAGGSEVSAPLAWYPRLARATPDERAVYEVEPGSRAVHWPLVNEDLRVSDVVLGRQSGEAGGSLARWEALMERRRAQIAAGEEPEPHYPTLPLPDWWDEEDDGDNVSPGA